MLEPPGINEEAGHWLVLGNEVNGQPFETVIQKAGHGAQVIENQVPAKADKIDSNTFKALMRDLGGKDESLNANLLPAPPPEKKQSKLKKAWKALSTAAGAASDVASAAS